MAKFLIKESSIKEEINERTLNLINGELSKFIDGLKFNISIRQGNYAFWESNDFSDENFKHGVDYDKLKVFLDNTLNFRYENFNITYLK